MNLVHITDLDGLADFERAFVGFFHAHNHAEEGCLAGTVRSDYAHNSVGRKHEVEVLEEELVSIGFAYADGIDDLVAQARTIGDENLEFFLALFLLLVEHAVICSQTGFGLGLTGFGCHANPLQLALEGLAALAGLFLFHGHSGGFLLQPRGVVTLPGNTFSAVQFENPACHIVEEIAIVGDGNHRSGVLLQVLFEPVDRLCVQVVGRLVKQQNIRLLQQQTT